MPTKKQLQEQVDKLEAELKWRIGLVKQLRDNPDDGDEIPPADIICNCREPIGWSSVNCNGEKYYCNQCYPKQLDIK